MRVLGAIALVVTGLIWASVVYPEYWQHTDMFRKWVPLLMRMPMPPMK